LSSVAIFGALRRHGLTLLLAMVGAVSVSLVWGYAAPATAEACPSCWAEEEQHNDETYFEDEEEERHEEDTTRILKIHFEQWGAVEVIDQDRSLDNFESWCETGPLYPCWWRVPKTDSVLITPRPAVGTTFTGWEGACSGTAPCELEMSEDREVIAGFIDQTPPPPPTIVTPAKDEVVHLAPREGVVVHFGGKEGTRTLLCRLDTSDYRVCWSPWTTRHLKAGPHTVRVKARDEAGNTSAPTTRRFTVVN
jgi:hypothetical protein